MTRTMSKLIVAAACFYTMNASAVFCPVPFDLKGAQNGVIYGNCSCEGNRISNVTMEQCDAAVRQLEMTEREMMERISRQKELKRKAEEDAAKVKATEQASKDVVAKSAQSWPQISCTSDGVCTKQYENGYKETTTMSVVKCKSPDGSTYWTDSCPKKHDAAKAKATEQASKDAAAKSAQSWPQISCTSDGVCTKQYENGYKETTIMSVVKCKNPDGSTYWTDSCPNSNNSKRRR